MEGLLGVLQHVVELGGAALKYTSEVPRNQRPANCFERRQRGRRKERGSGVMSQVNCGNAFYFIVVWF